MADLVKECESRGISRVYCAETGKMVDIHRASDSDLKRALDKDDNHESVISRLFGGWL